MPDANYALLTQLARTSGGQYFNLRAEADEQILPNIGMPAFSLLSVEYKDGEIADVYPRGVQPVRGRMAITGKLKAPEAQLTLNYGFGTQVTHRAQYTLQQQERHGNRPGSALLGAAESRRSGRLSREESR